MFALRSVWLAHDRRALLTHAFAAAANGSIVLCDRYPSLDADALDGSQLAAEVDACDAGRVRRWLARLEARLYRDVPAADLVIRLTAPLEVTPETHDHCQALFRQQVVDPNAHLMVAVNDEGEVVAFCSLHFRPRLNYASEEAWIPDLIVRERSRRKGIGQALLAEAGQRASARGCRFLTLESGYQRTEAHHLYRRFGMQDDGRSFIKRLDAPDAPGRPS